MRERRRASKASIWSLLSITGPDQWSEYAAQFDISRQYATVEELLRAGDVDILVVSTPNYLHAPQSSAALERAFTSWSRSRCR